MKSKVPQYRRNPATDPHLPHTTRYVNRDDLQIPPEADALIKERWPEVVRTFQQYDQGAGMLMLYTLVRDACKAAKWPDSMAYQMRDYIIGILNKGNVKPFPGDRVFKIEAKALDVVDRLLEHCGHCPDDPENRHKVGLGVEREHTKDPKKLEKIVNTHQGENPNYYPTKPKPKGAKEVLRWLK